MKKWSNVVHYQQTLNEVIADIVTGKPCRVVGWLNMPVSRMDDYVIWFKSSAERTIRELGNLGGPIHVRRIVEPSYEFLDCVNLHWEITP